MRAMVLGVLALAGCAPEVGFGTYLCGVEQDCPDGQSCNGPDNRCVRKADAEPFACSASEEHEPDNQIANAFALPAMDCVSLPVTIGGCLADGDTEDWLKFEVPGNCTAVVARIRSTYPIAFEEVPFEITTGDGVVLEQSGECGPNETALDDHGLRSKCLRRTVMVGKTMGIHVKADSLFACGGACAFNRYALTVQLESP